MYKNINDLLKNSESHNIILLFGEDEFAREEAQNLLIKKFVATEDDKFNFDIFDGEDAKLNQIIDLCRSYPMMTERRVVLVKRFDKLFLGRTSKKIETSSPVANYLESPSETTVLILTASIDGVKDVFKTFNSSSKDAYQKKVGSIKFPYNKIISKYCWMEFPRVYESEYPKWVESRLKSFGKTIDHNALEILVSRTKQTLRDLSNEVDKLVLATEGVSNISLKDVSFLTGSTREYTVFELQKAIAERNIAKAVMIMNKILAVDRQEMLMIAIYSKFFTNLLKICDDFRVGMPPNSMSSKLGISPYQFNDYSLALKKYSPDEIEFALLAICETDLKMKSSNSDGLMVMQNMLFEIMEKKYENPSLL
ncbi:MAG: DNA polymerase III subunit delta [Candidatus Kapabacteria bacterium]|nr:DNA polymerase III subunit delta [Ignavibacteriota bacterium]MCW5883708.1 DNA polymerase III subunit delta [Candidatus Kapabacteria bacterium]